jgi:hypothetical protein
MGCHRRVVLVAVSALSFVGPAGLCLVVAFAPARSAHVLALLTIAAGAWMALIVLVNWWEFTSLHLRWAWSAVFVAVAAWRALQSQWLPWLAPPTWGDAALLGLLLVGFWLLGNALRARRAPAWCLELASPLSAGTYLVTDGGDGARSFLVNYHYGFGRHRASGVNASMRYALDLVAIGPGGCESDGFIPTTNAAYRIWSRALVAPCDGRVVHVVDDIADNSAFGSNRPYGVGNHVVLSPGNGIYLVLGHLKQGSVAVAVGQDVRAGQGLGRVGNSGWTERPHLHMQAMRSVTGDWWHGEPVAIRLSGRFPVRNQVVRAMPILPDGRARGEGKDDRNDRS